MIRTVLFDLDGTLLPMDNDLFVKTYFGYLSEAARGWGYTDSRKLINTIWAGVEAMVKNDGSKTNFDAFWECFAKVYGVESLKDIENFNTFYATDFNKARFVSDIAPLAGEAVRIAREGAEHVILATNPIFPRVADETRLSWLGLTCSDFDLVTDYDNCSLSKPNPGYYLDVAGRVGSKPEECLMIGNDVEEDVIAAQEAGMSCFLLTAHVINRKNLEADCPQGSYEDMVKYLEKVLLRKH